MMGNKKGDMSIAILVLGVVAVCAIALANFYFAGISTKNDFEIVKVVGKVDSFSKDIDFYLSEEINEVPENVMEIFDGGFIQGDVVFRGKVEENDIYVIEAEQFTSKRKLENAFNSEKIVLVKVIYKR